MWGLPASASRLQCSACLEAVSGGRSFEQKRTQSGRRSDAGDSAITATIQLQDQNYTSSPDAAGRRTVFAQEKTQSRQLG
mmetsp:Transcript_33026/g.59933  ORF Transcript_33026/g.59933 Transcript_33026/m.59933 type:complete len:80 (-) Transcript_33026:601-840(-)